jgi:biopolymer transport protein ExbD
MAYPEPYHALNRKEFIISQPNCIIEYSYHTGFSESDMSRHRHLNRIALQRNELANYSRIYAIVYFGIVFIAFICTGVIEIIWEPYPRIQSPMFDQVPTAAPSKAFIDRTAILIAVDPHGNVYFNNREVTLDQLGQIVRSNARFGSERVYIKADQACSYGVVMRVMRVCKNSGARDIRILLRRSPHLVIDIWY